ncbi:hypothetical protein LSAT2_020816 [Lamellibrachia satsuma]|nr:hypothetical protein LSAT2_020816 [Lamellibrachia satsuma]
MNYKSLPTIRVRHNRRTTLRPLNQMNGDHLGQLRAPRFSEWSKNVSGHNASSTALLKRDVRVWYEEHGNTVEKIRRKQEKTYKVGHVFVDHDDK